ncbi:hypothetical protein ElyMa_004115300 [Elysia marginata]|uniref:Uncharacterized protein n=1 Tax=Elysia marginata TaxID=1093978 RepID=A0AAV4GDK7_9GAST|nr:hypothetical protein ElyMa_004115300 [Elysia marginata]
MIRGQPNNSFPPPAPFPQKMSARPVSPLFYFENCASVWRSMCLRFLLHDMEGVDYNIRVTQTGTAMMRTKLRSKQHSCLCSTMLCTGATHDMGCSQQVINPGAIEKRRDDLDFFTYGTGYCLELD